MTVNRGRRCWRSMLAAALGTALMVTAETALTADDAGDGNEAEALFKKGMKALKDDRLQSAIEAFNSILSSNPRLHRARLELAVAYYRSLRYAEARRLAQEVLDDPTTPAEVRVSILAFLAQVDKDEQRFMKRHEFRPSISVGLMYDSNVNVGPSADVVEINGQVLQLISGQKRSDNALLLNAGLAHRYKPGKTFTAGELTGSFEWLTQVNLYNREYNDENDFDLTVLSGSTGPAWVVLGHWRATLNLRLDKIWLGNDPLALFSGINPLATWQFQNGEITLDASLTRRDYSDAADSGREGTYKSLGAALGHYYKQRRIAAQAGVRVFDFNADDDRFGNDGWELFLGGIVRAWQGGSLYARASYKDLAYDGQEPLFNVARDERERRLTAGFRHSFRTGRLDKWSLNGSFSYTDNDSNVAIYDYDRRQLSINLSRTF
ncbi:DUF2860 family protein [Thiohalobacter sp. IOR34]|uniref:surface lipoprotein assembly modifier n=1 Tax=Thiohalobacter sp. IOR34 TaxID=3057176 RepID=UPI0025B26509|nr:DUF2860 family protein [Thiohalobacter sp. IOR34]WJW74643.1 DUF2860 family protein [Thiohalobacter sp. IOR34]